MSGAGNGGLMSEQEQRDAVLAEARSWLRTPFHHAARVKGAGVDCAQILIAVYSKAGIIREFTPEFYRAQWHFHRSEERYLATIGRFAKEFPGPPKPADVAVFKFARCFSHGAIVLEWPTVIHAYIGRGVELCDVSKDAGFIGRPVKFFTAWGLA